MSTAAGAGFPQAFRAEWIKLRTVRSTAWSPWAGLALALVFTTIVCSASSTDGCPPGNECDDIAFNSLAGIWIAQIAVAVLAVLAITSEYATGTIRATFAANPRRLTVLAAKAAAVGAVVAGVGLAASFASYRLGQSILPGNGYTPANGYSAASLGDGATLRAVVGSGLYLVVLALFCLGIGTIVRHTAGAITTVLGLLLFPFIASIFLSEHLGETVQKFSPMIGLVIQSTVEDSVPLDPWAGFGVTCAYAGASLLLAFWLIRRRDA